MVNKYCLIKKGACSSFKKVDIFGANVEFTFKGQKNFTTVIGAVISAIMFALFISFFAVRTSKLVSHEDPFLSMMAKEPDEGAIDLWELDYFFAVEKPDPRVGRLYAYQMEWNDFGPDQERIKTEIEFVDCKEYLEGGLYEDN